MRLLFINQFFWPDTAATGQLLADVAREAALRNADVSVLCGQSGYGGADGAPRPPVTILRCGSTRFSRGILGRVLSYVSFLAAAVCKAFTTPRADIVVTLTTPPLLSLLGTALAKIRGSRHYIWEMDLYPDIAEDLGVLKRGALAAQFIGALADWSRNSADGILALGEDMKARLVARGIDPRKIHVVENWADGQQIVPLRFPPGPPGQHIVVHYSGNLGLAHDVETLASAMKMWRLTGDGRARFVFTGGGPRRQWLQAFCARENITAAEFRPYTDRAELGTSLAEGHLGLVTQLTETCGSVVPSKIYGIMAAGRPVLYIGPKGATPATIIEKYRCGWRIEPGDAQGLAGLLEWLAGHSDQIRDAGAKARRAFEENYDRPIGVQRILSVLGLLSTAEQEAISLQNQKETSKV
jgi:colanic acid biosynthesis glycosyl transferase WcaI